MGRPRGFDERAVLAVAGRVFVTGGYAGTSIDDLVTALDLQRGSLYAAFGSKRGLFVAALRHHVGDLVCRPPRRTGAQDPPVGGADVDLLLVAALERGHRDPEVAALVRRGLALLDVAPALLTTDVPTTDVATTDLHTADLQTAERGDAVPARAVALLSRRLWERLLPVADRLDDTERPTTTPPTPEET